MIRMILGKCLGKQLIICALLKLLLGVLLLGHPVAIVAEEIKGSSAPCKFRKPSNKIRLKNKVRTKAVQNLDDFLHWTIPLQRRAYVTEELTDQLIYYMQLSQADDFMQWHGYFSVYDPLVSRVSKKKGDILTAQSLLMHIAHDITDQKSRQFAMTETLAKVIAYRDLKMGDHFVLLMEDQQGEYRLRRYQVDHVFNLWYGMPAFGLVCDENGDAILLFRGTDFSLSSQRGWASLVSDVDVAGPGLTAFMHARQEISTWLKMVASSYNKAKVIGFSLGGVLAAYTFLYENEWVDLNGCVSFNPPGFSERVFQDWNRLPQEKQEALTVYVNHGDPISKVGRLFGKAYEISVKRKLTPLKAHTLFLTAEPEFTCIPINLDRENKAR